MEILKVESQLEIRSKIIFYFIQGIGFSLTVIISGVLLIQYLLDLENSISKISFFQIIVLFIFSFFQSMWYVFGYEKIIIDTKQNYLQIIKSNYLFTFSKKYSLEEIKRVESYQYKKGLFNTYREYIKEMQKAFFWSEMGRIYLFIGVNKITVLNGLGQSDSNKALLLLVQSLETPDGSDM